MFHQFLEWSDNSGLSQWLLSICTFAVVLLVSLIARRVIWRRLEIWARSTQSPLVATFLIELRFPVVVFLIITALGIGMQMAPAAIKAYPVVGYGSKVTFIIFSVWLLERILSAFFRSQSLPTFFAGSTKTLLLTVSRLFLLAFGLLVVLDTVGISITPILASLGVGSVAVALALQDTLGNFFSGLYILIDKPIRIGDFVKVDEGIEGHVTKIGWRSTHIQMLSNNTVVLPNSKVASSQLTNFDMPDRETAVLVQVGVSYDCDLDHVERVTVEVAKQVLRKVTGGVPGFDPFIRYHTFGDSSVNFTVILRAQQFTDNFLLKHEFTKALHARYRQENISIPFPQRVIHLKNEKS